MRDPHHRVIAAQQSIRDSKKSKDPKVVDLVCAFCKDAKAKPELVIAVEKFCDNYQRTVLDTLLLGRADTEQIYKATEVRPDVITAYKEYLFDQSVFNDGLERISWVRSLQKLVEPDELQLLQCVLSVGVPYVIWLITGRGHFSPAEVIRYSMNDAMFRGMAHRTAPIDSDIAKGALQWMRTAERLAKTLNDIDPQDEEEARKQLRIALDYQDTTVNEQTSGIPANTILH